MIFHVIDTLKTNEFRGEILAQVRILTLTALGNISYFVNFFAMKASVQELFIMKDAKTKQAISDPVDEHKNTFLLR